VGNQSTVLILELKNHASLQGQNGKKLYIKAIKAWLHIFALQNKPNNLPRKKTGEKKYRSKA
jgi:hypothetical protein